MSIPVFLNSNATIYVQNNMSHPPQLVTKTISDTSCGKYSISHSVGPKGGIKKFNYNLYQRLHDGSEGQPNEYYSYPTERTLQYLMNHNNNTKSLATKSINGVVVVDEKQ